MASALDLMGRGVMNRSNHHPASAIGMMLADTSIGFGASYGLTQVYARYGETNKAAKHVFEIAGGVGKLVEGLLTVFVGPGWASGLFGALGQAGLNGLAMDLAFTQVRKEKGIALVKVPAGTDVKKLKSGDAVPASTYVGALPPADPGRGLAWDHIQELASMH
jgi:hypothetical protein